ncbi:MAG TPA: hypothetical protein VMH77_02320 [Steroidobacteraceae bacterium]|nr:hypothetical protein [Steroidobacteraceae bacterium]
MSLKTSADLFAHSLRTLRGHRGLLAFPLVSFLAGMAIFALALPPLFHVTAVDAWRWLWHPTLNRQMARSVAMAPFNDIGRLPYRWLVASWLSGAFALTFVRLAFYSQAIRALNGDVVSVGRGFFLALQRLPAAAAWALFAGTIGVFLDILDRILGPLAELILDATVVYRATGERAAALVCGFFVRWSVIAQFVVPAMLAGPQVLNPVGNLKISARLLKRLWDDGVEDALVIGHVGPSGAGYLASACLYVALLFAGFATHLYSLQLWGLILAFAGFCLTDAVNGVFRCGLYIYATEGVLPGPFDDELFRRTWAVREQPCP